MKVGILSDTHIRKGRTLPRYLWHAFDGIEAILHAGDLVIDNVIY